MPQLLAIAILLAITFWVSKDARSRGMDSTFWAVFVFALLIIALPAYFITRKGKIEVEEDESEEPEEENETSDK